MVEASTVPNLLKAHLQDVEEMIVRDKNHPSVIAFSLFNEPETTSEISLNRKTLKALHYLVFLYILVGFYKL